MRLDDLRYSIEDNARELREKLAKNQYLLAGILLLVLVTSLGLITCHLTRSGVRPASVKLVYFDLDTQRIRVIDHMYPAEPTSPLKGTQNVFLASVFACEAKPRGTLKDGMSLDDLQAEEMFIDRLEKIDPSVTAEAAIFGKGFSYRTLDEDQWHDNGSPEHEDMQQKLLDRCPDPKRCYP